MFDDDKVGSLGAWKPGSLELCILCAVMIRLEVCKFGSLHVVCDDDRFGSLEVCKFTCCV